jgi:hypothetical protein
MEFLGFSVLLYRKCRMPLPVDYLRVSDCKRTYGCIKDYLVANHVSFLFGLAPSLVLYIPLVRAYFPALFRKFYVLDLHSFAYPNSTVTLPLRRYLTGCLSPIEHSLPRIPQIIDRCMPPKRPKSSTSGVWLLLLSVIVGLHLSIQDAPI